MDDDYYCKETIWRKMTLKCLRKRLKDAYEQSWDDSKRQRWVWRELVQAPPPPEGTPLMRTVAHESDSGWWTDELWRSAWVRCIRKLARFSWSKLNVYHIRKANPKCEHRRRWCLSQNGAKLPLFLQDRKDSCKRLEMCVVSLLFNWSELETTRFRQQPTDNLCE